MDFEDGVDGDEGGHGAYRGFTLLHGPPPALPKKKLGAALRDCDLPTSQDLFLAAYPAVSPKESKQRRLERAAVCEERLTRLQVSIAVRACPAPVAGHRRAAGVPLARGTARGWFGRRPTPPWGTGVSTIPAPLPSPCRARHRRRRSRPRTSMCSKTSCGTCAGRMTTAASSC